MKVQRRASQRPMRASHLLSHDPPRAANSTRSRQRLGGRGVKGGRPPLQAVNFCLVPPRSWRSCHAREASRASAKELAMLRWRGERSEP